jgi:hypothetical protein
MSPILFNIVVDMLAILIARAKEAGQIEGIIPHLVQDGLSILQYADDKVIFMGHDEEKAINMKLILTTFEQLSGSKLISIKVKFSAMEKRRIMKSFIRNYLGVSWESAPFVTLACPCILGD